MSEERTMSQRFTRLLAILGAWSLGGLSVFMFLGDSLILGILIAFVGLIVLMIAITGMPERKRPYTRLELLVIWIGFPMVVTTLVILLAVGFLPSNSIIWVAIYLLVVAILFGLLILEARRPQLQQ